MTLQEAIRSGKRYRPVGNVHWYNRGGASIYSTSEVLAEYEVEEELEDARIERKFTSTLGRDMAIYYLNSSEYENFIKIIDPQVSLIITGKRVKK